MTTRSHCFRSGRQLGRFALLAAWCLSGLSTARAQGTDGPRAIPAEQARLTANHARLYEELGREADDVQRFVRVLKKVVQLVRPTVVHIEAEKETGSEASRRHVEEAGSGVIVEMSGQHYVVTNRHVVKDAETRRIKLKLDDGREVRPSRVWSDRGTDVAVLAINVDGVVPARFGDSDDLEIGDFVLAMGSPFGLSHSVTFGIVSAKNRRNLSLGDEGLRYQNFIQTDAAINPGNSGGPLLNLRGEVVGINTAIASNSGKNEGIGFSIPSNMVRAVAVQLIQNGSVQRAFLGVNLDAGFNAAAATRLGLPTPRGALVRGVTPRSPAEVAKIQAGDVILLFNGRPVEDDNHLVNLVSLTPIGSEVPVVIYRERERLDLSVVVGDRNAFAPE